MRQFKVVRRGVVAAWMTAGLLGAAASGGLAIPSSQPRVSSAPASAPQGSWVSWGSDVGGVLGTGYASFTRALTPVGVLVAGPEEVVAEHAALMANGTVQTWGENDQGEIGDGTRQRKLNPITVPGLSNVVQIAGAGEHMIALLANGTVATWGSNISGELGNGTDGGGYENCTTNCYSTVPVQVPNLTGARSVFAAGSVDGAVLDSGEVSLWGEDLGGGKSLHDSPTLVPGLHNVRTVALGARAARGGHMFALLNNGKVEALGFNGQGQLGIGSTVSSSVAVKVPALTGATALSSSWTHSLALVGDKLLAWGDNANGELGVKTTTLCGAASTAKPCATTPVQVPLEGVSSIAAGYAASDAVSNGHAYSTGENKFGQLGDGNKIDRATFGPVSGLEGALKVEAAGSSAFAEISGAAPPPVIEALPAPGALDVNWRGSGGTGWIVASRPASCCLIHKTPPFEAKTELPATVRSYAFSGSPGQPYEISVHQKSGSFGTDVVEGTPQSG